MSLIIKCISVLIVVKIVIEYLIVAYAIYLIPWIFAHLLCILAMHTIWDYQEIIHIPHRYIIWIGVIYDLYLLIGCAYFGWPVELPTKLCLIMSGVVTALM